MKKISLLFLQVCIVMAAQAQLIVNSSFENWSSRFGKTAPDGWICDSASLANGSISRATGGSQGNYALKLGTVSTQTGVEGAFVQRKDSLSAKPGNLLFDYKIFNNNTSPSNGLYIEIYFQDAKKKDLKDFNVTLSNNISTFGNGILPIAFDAGQVPKYYTLIVSYFNVGGLTNEYTIVDNLRFEGASGSVSPLTFTKPGLCFPNPTSGAVHINPQSGMKASKAILYGIDGTMNVAGVSDSELDLSNLANGLYFIELYDVSNQIIGRDKLNVQH